MNWIAKRSKGQTLLGIHPAGDFVLRRTLPQIAKVLELGSTQTLKGISTL